MTLQEMATTIQFNVGDIAPLNKKAANSFEEFCFACGRKLGKNLSYFEVTNDWKLVIPNTSHFNSQGCFPVGSECAKKFGANLLIKLQF